jgi:hypothetical protein
MKPFDRVLEHLGNKRQQGDGYIARCPAHDDQHSSLSIHEGPDGRALLHCFAGCEIGEIVKAINLELRDLFPEGVTHFGDRGGHASSTQVVTLEKLAADKKLPRAAAERAIGQPRPGQPGRAR